MAAFLYSLLFRVALDFYTATRILLIFSEDGMVWGRDRTNLSTFFYVVLTLSLVLLVVFFYEKIHGSFVFIYAPSFLAYFLMSFWNWWAGTFVIHSRQLDITVRYMVINGLIGPGMIMMISYFPLAYRRTYVNINSKARKKEK